MSVDLQFKHMCGDKDAAVLDIVFIHGIKGDPEKTWTNSQGVFWPCWLASELEVVCIHTVGYPSSLFGRWSKKEMNLHERASSLVEHMVSCGIGGRPLVIVCHSLGGLLVKALFRACCESQNEDWNALSDQLKLVAFFATPHKGASLAVILKTLMPRLSSPFINALGDESGYLTDLNNSYRNLATKKGIATIAYCEKFETKNAMLLVPEDSADPGCEIQPIAVDADHIDICKPSTKEAPVYRSVLHRIRKVLEGYSGTGSDDSETIFGPDNYGVRSHDDRRTLQEKLIDAGREHQYSSANNLQNRFARTYHRLGLFTEAKARHDKILSAIEQRFVTHVYGPKICLGATQDEIAKALQEHVIDPLCAPSEFGTLAESTVLQGLYYLTEQCHIQWDKP